MRCGHFLPPPYLLCNRLESRWQRVAHRHPGLDTRWGEWIAPHPTRSEGQGS